MPYELIEYRICQHFGWTPDELDKQDARKVHDFITIIGLENQLKRANAEAARGDG